MSVELRHGQRVTVTIHDIAFGGDGVGRWEEFVMFVPFVALGEEVEIEITEVKKKFARGRLVRVIKLRRIGWLRRVVILGNAVDASISTSSTSGSLN